MKFMAGKEYEEFQKQEHEKQMARSKEDLIEEIKLLRSMLDTSQNRINGLLEMLQNAGS
jgi:hypothetical protein